MNANRLNDNCWQNMLGQKMSPMNQSTRSSSIPSAALRRVLVLAAALACASLTGCVIVTNSDTTTTGRKIDASVFDQVQLGKSKDFVVNLLGEPTEKRMLDGGVEQWRWRYTERHESDGAFIVLFASHKADTSTQTRVVEFKDGVVTRVTTE